MEKDGRSMRGSLNEQGSTTMKQPDEVAAIMALKRLGVGNKTIAQRLGMSKTMVKRYIAAEGWVEYQKPDRARALEGHKEWLSEQMRKHRNNAEVVRQELAREKGIHVSLRTVERAVHWQRALARAEIEAMTRFESGPGE
jgi:transposase